MPESNASEIAVVQDDAPLVLSGPPGRLKGRVALSNPGDAKVVFRNVGLKDPNGVLDGLLLRHTLPAVALRPNQERSVPFAVTLDPSTPPGEYLLELDVAGQTRSAVLQVAEVFDLSIRPDSIVVANFPGKPQLKRMVVTNNGNVAFTIGDFGDVDLKDDLMWDREVMRAVEPLVNQTDVKIEELLVTVLKLAREDVFKVAGVTVRNASGKTEIAPGETAALDLEITVHDGLPANRRYRGTMPFLTEDLEIVVVSAGDPIQSEPQAAPEVIKTVKKAATSLKKAAKGGKS